MNSDPNSVEEGETFCPLIAFCDKLRVHRPIRSNLKLNSSSELFGFFPKGKKRKPRLAMDSHVFRSRVANN